MNLSKKIKNKSLILSGTFLCVSFFTGSIMAANGTSIVPSPEDDILGDGGSIMSVKPIRKSSDALASFEQNYAPQSGQSSNTISAVPSTSTVMVGDVAPSDEESILQFYELDEPTDSNLGHTGDPLDILDQIGGEDMSPNMNDPLHDHSFQDATMAHVTQKEMDDILITHISRVNNGQFHDNQEYLDYVQAVINQARLAAKMRDIETAEKNYLRILTGALPKEIYQSVLMEMGRLYKDNDREGQAAAVYERFVQDFPQHERSPIVHLELARLYREMGAPNSAINSYYDVINAALALPSDVDPMKYRRFSLTAQFEIAGTFLELSNTDILKKPEGYNESYLEMANKYLDRLLRLPLDKKKLGKAVYRSAYAKYKMQDYPGVVKQLEGYSTKFSESDLIPESYYLQSIAYKELDKPKQALDSVIELLNYNQEQQVSNPKSWAFWKKRTGNQLANTFYEEGDYFKALQLYQALYKVDNDVTWQASTLYQIGLCFERLGMFPKASEAYQMLSDWSAWEGDDYETDENLALIRDMATWRKENLNWTRQADNYINKITIPEIGE